MSNEPVISVVIPAYNRLDSLLALLGDVHRQVGIDYEVIVVDDHSVEDPRAAIAAAFPRVTVLRNQVNSGPAVTRNRGIRAAHGRILVGFDSDVTLPDTTVLYRTAALLEHNHTVDGIAFRLLQSDGKTDDAARWWHPVPLITHANRRFATSYFSGTAYAFRRSAVLAAGLFPEIFFIHYEEVELAFRILDRGGVILYGPELTVLHHAHAVSKRSEILAFYKPRNQILLAAGCFPLASAFGFALPRVAFHFLRAIKHGHLKSFVRALLSAGELLPARLAERHVLQPATFRRIRDLRLGVPV